MCNQDTCVYFNGQPSVVIGNSLFITGCWKTTWTWNKEAGRMPNGREEKRISLAVMSDQGLAKETQAKGHLCKLDEYAWKPNIGLVRYSLRKRKEKGKRENWTKEIRTRPRIARTGEGYQVSLTLIPRTSHLTRRRSTRPLPPPLPSHLNPRYQDPNGQRPTPGRGHFRHDGRLDAHSVCSSHASYTCGQWQQ